MWRLNSLDECLVQYMALSRIVNGDMSVSIPSDHHRFEVYVDLMTADIAINCITKRAGDDFYKVTWPELAGLREGFNKSIEWYAMRK